MAVNAKPTTANYFIQIPKKKEGRKPIQKASNGDRRFKRILLKGLKQIGRESSKLQYSQKAKGRVGMTTKQNAQHIIPSGGYYSNQKRHWPRRQKKKAQEAIPKMVKQSQKGLQPKRKSNGQKQPKKK